MGCTLKDIAAEAGVSTATVSLVLNNKPCRIAESTRKVILDIAKRNHYVPNSSARALVMRQSLTLGLIIPDISNPYFSELAKGVEREAQKQGYSIIFCNSDDSGKKDVANFKLLSSRQIDGLILVTSIGGEDVEQANQFNRMAAESGVPVVQFDRQIIGGSYDTISIDHQHGGYLATRFLMEQGYQRIGCITGPLAVPSARNRYEGYVQALAERGLTPAPHLVAHGDYTLLSGTQAAPGLLDAGVDAVFACNDQMAFGVLRALKQRKLKAGRDIALVGFDNSPICEYLDIPLTTVDQPVYEMGKSACNMLLKAIAGKRSPTAQQTLRFSPHLIIRETTPMRRKGE